MNTILTRATSLAIALAATAITMLGSSTADAANNVLYLGSADPNNSVASGSKECTKASGWVAMASPVAGAAGTVAGLCDQLSGTQVMSLSPATLLTLQRKQAAGAKLTLNVPITSKAIAIGLAKAEVTGTVTISGGGSVLGQAEVETPTQAFLSAESEQETFSLPIPDGLDLSTLTVTYEGSVQLCCLGFTAFDQAAGATYLASPPSITW